MIETLRELRHRTCASLVGHWLRGTARVRARYLGWPAEAGEQEEAPAHVSKKARSFHTHDAQFRFQCLQAQLVTDGEASPGLIAVRESMFAPCEDRPPYRRPDSDVARHLPTALLTGPRAVGMLRREGLGVLLARLATQLETRWRDLSSTARDRLELLFLRSALAPTTVHALDLDRRGDVVERIRALPAMEMMEAAVDEPA